MVPEVRAPTIIKWRHILVICHDLWDGDTSVRRVHPILKHHLKTQRSRRGPFPYTNTFRMTIFQELLVLLLVTEAPFFFLLDPECCVVKYRHMGDGPVRPWKTFWTHYMRIPTWIPSPWTDLVVEYCLLYAERQSKLQSSWKSTDVKSTTRNRIRITMSIF